MEVNEAIRTRRAIRGYKPDPVPREVFEKIVDAAQWSSSPGNMQPWEFAILGGEMMETFRKRLIEFGETNVPMKAEFPRPLEIPEKYNTRRTKYYRENFDKYVYPPGTENPDEKRKAHFAKGGRMFEAPNAIIVYTDPEVLQVPWMFISIGLIIDAVCLAAVEQGLGTCIMGRPVDWPDQLRALLGLEATKVPVLGIAIGYPDYDYKPNVIPRIRMPLDEWVHYYDVK